MHFPSEWGNLPGATCIRGQIKVNHLHLNLHEASAVRQGLAIRIQMINALSWGQGIDSLAWQVHKSGRPFPAWKPAHFGGFRKLPMRFNHLKFYNQLCGNEKQHKFNTNLFMIHNEHDKWNIDRTIEIFIGKWTSMWAKIDFTRWL